MKRLFLPSESHVASGIAGLRCEYELLTSVQTLSWSIDTDPPAVLHAQEKNKFRRLQHSSEE